MLRSSPALWNAFEKLEERTLLSATVSGLTADDVRAVRRAPVVAAADASVVEDDAGTETLSFTVTRTGRLRLPSVVSYRTVAGSALSDVDFEAKTGRIRFGRGVTTKTITVTVTNDTTFEGGVGVDQNLLLRLRPVLNARVADKFARGAIEDNDTEPTISIADAAVVEGNAGTAQRAVTLTLSNASDETITVDYSTAGDTATDGTDYDDVTGTVTFAPRTTTATFNLPVIGDTIDEADETIDVTLANADEATIADGAAVITITDDDATPELSIADVTVDEDAGTVTLTVTATNASSQAIDVDYATADGTAEDENGDDDYTDTSGTLTIPAGNTTGTFTVAITDDALDEAAETFTVALGNAVNATISGTADEATVTITDDDATPTLSVDDVTDVEGDAGTSNYTFTVTLSAASGQTVTVNYATSDGTASAGTDYTAIASTLLTFNPGETTKTFNVVVAGDADVEADETFTVTLATPTNATLADGTGTGTIQNDD